MRFVKKFEAWAGKPLPVIPTHLIMKYFKCNECGEINMDRSLSKCTECDSRDVKEISEDDYDKEAKKRVPKAFWNLLDKRREEFKDEFIPIQYLNKRNDS
jgi:predicted ATP-dependent serine protease